MTRNWMHRAPTVVALAWAILAGPTQAAVVTYNFNLPITSYFHSSGFNTPTGAYAGSFAVDTALLAQSTNYIDTDPDYGYVSVFTSDPVYRPITVAPAVAGTPHDTLANAPLSGPSTYSDNSLYLSTGALNGNYFQLLFHEVFNSQLINGDGIITNNYESRILRLEFFNFSTIIVDGYKLVAPGSGSITARITRTMGFDQISAEGIYLGGSSSELSLTANGVTVPEPRGVALLELGMLALAARRRRCRSDRGAISNLQPITM